MKSDSHTKASQSQEEGPYHVYILKCGNGKLYTGMTNNIKRRLDEHNSGRGGHFTKYAGPFTLIWEERQPNAALAARRETQIKGWTRRKKLALIQANYKLLKES